MKHCPRCGFKNEDLNNYCDKCNYPLDQSKPRHDFSHWSSLSMGKKVSIVIGIVIIAILLFSMMTIFNTAEKKAQEPNILTSNDTASDYSSKPFKLDIHCKGQWNGEVGPIDNKYKVSGDGDKSLNINAAPWDNVVVNISKSDNSNEELKVELFKSGFILGENTTSSPYGNVELTSN